MPHELPLSCRFGLTVIDWGVGGISVSCKLTIVSLCSE